MKPVMPRTLNPTNNLMPWLAWRNHLPLSACDEGLVHTEELAVYGLMTPKKHISKNKDRDIPYKSPYNEAQ